jgi:hypothetical protein
LDGTIFLDGNAYVSNQGGGINTIKLGATGNTTSQGANNIFIGTEAGKGVSSGADGDDIVIGYQSHKNSASFSFDNVFIGTQTGMNNVNGSSHTLIGYQAGYSSTTADRNTFFGYQVGYANISGADNSYFGVNAGKNNTIGLFNTAIGYNAGSTYTSSSTFIGANADATTNVSYSVAIGYNAKVSQDYSLVFGSITDPVQVGINTNSPRADLDVNSTGAIILPGGDTTQRPATPVKGMIRFNSTTSKLEAYNGTAWINVN